MIILLVLFFHSLLGADPLDSFKSYLDQGTYEGQDWSDFSMLPLSRYDTFKAAFTHFENNDGKIIVELGTSRSFTHGGLPGCNSDDVSFWTPEHPENWDWGAGFFTRMAATCLGHLNPQLHTVDLLTQHIARCQVMTSDFDFVHYHVDDSVHFLKHCQFPNGIDLLYLDTGDMTPIEPTALLQLEEVQAVVEGNLISKNGIILIDDVKNQTPKKFGETSHLGKAKYSLPYLLENGFEIVMDEYQVLLRRKAKASPPKILHITFHKGCEKEFAAIAQHFGFDTVTWYIPDLPQQFFDPLSSGNVLYNIGHERAQRIWQKHADYFNSFDCIITSDTAPLARIFLQNNFKKPLLIWICNRFDYCDYASLDCDFPDDEFYQLFREAKNKRNVTFIAYTPFEHVYAKTKDVDTGDLTIRPCAANLERDSSYVSSIPAYIDKSSTFFLPPYHNELYFISLSSKCAELGISSYCGRYNGANDLKDFKGIIHLPYSWSTLAFFENMSLGIPYFVPTPSFFLQLAAEGNYFHPNLSYLTENHLFALSEWYAPEHAALITYFDSWDDLQKKVVSINYPEMREKITVYSTQHREYTLKQWKQLFNTVFR